MTLHKLVSKLREVLRFWLYPYHVVYILYHLCGSRNRKPPDIERITERLIGWLDLAYRRADKVAVSMCYNFYRGWLLPYPETNGYLIDTYIALWKRRNDQKFLERAIHLADWELKIQHPSGGVRVGNEFSETLDVFDTGMVLLGLTGIYEITKEESYLAAAIKCGDWLYVVQDASGCWSNYTFKNNPHAYHSKVDYALLKLYHLTNNVKYKEALERNLDWIFDRQHPNGWYEDQSFTKEEDPYTHTMAYTIQGLVSLHNETKDPDLRTKIYRSLDKYFNGLLSINKNPDKEDDVFILKGQYNKEFRPTAKYMCPTGNVQFSVAFYRLYKSVRKEQYKMIADNLLSAVNKIYRSFGRKNPLNGLPGSYPIWGKYHPYEFPNWTVKFYLDALMEHESVHQ